MAPSTDKARFNMIQQQIRPWDVIDSQVLNTMMAISREAFVPDAYRALAYADIEVPMNAGQKMLAPRVVARMLQALDVKDGDKVLEIGTGTGYVTACLSRLGGKVTSIELDEELLQRARNTLQTQGFKDLDLRSGDGLAGPVLGGPFDVIAVTGSLPGDDALEALQEQLADTGRLFAIVGEGPAMHALLLTRTDDSLRREDLFETSLPPLTNAPQPEQFNF